MGILADESIRRRLPELFAEGGDGDRVQSCGYTLRPDRVFSAERPEDGFELKPGSSFVIRPGQLVWVRFADRVSLPPDLCALYMQTNHFARRGLLMMNASLVAPGYTGFLTAAFVNFGRVERRITRTDQLARIVFMELDAPARDVQKLVYTDAHTYDETLLKELADAPRTFLNVDAVRETLESSLDTTIERAVNERVEGLARRTFVQVATGGGIGVLLVSLLFYLLNASLVGDFVRQQLVDDDDLSRAVGEYLRDTRTKDELSEIQRRLERLEAPPPPAPAP